MIIDSHCHLNYEPMSLSLKETIDRANKDGVKYLLTISTEDKSFDKTLILYPKINVFMDLMEYIRMKLKIINLLSQRT